MKKPPAKGALLAKSSGKLKLKPTPAKGKLEVSKQASQDVTRDGTREAMTKSGGSSGKSASNSAFRLPTKELLRIFDGMVKARCLEERLIRMYKQNDGYFWIGGPGEEAFNIPLGLQVKKGQGLDYDFLHLHYRSSGIVLSMGAEPMDMIRQMKNTATDPFSGGRNFGNHTSIRKWNVVPISSTIETQYATAIGTGIAQRQHGGDAITIVNGGDAGTAEGEFASCLVWASRPGNELPILMIVTNNEYGISTPARTQHGEKHIADRGTAFGIKNRVINGNDVEESYLAIQEAMAYVRKERKPFLLEARVSRLYGHSSASGANFVQGEEDPLITFERKLVSAGAISKAEVDALRERYTAEFLDMAKKVKEEPMPDGSTIYDHTFKGQKGRYF
jgi:2-oxoisovalerate dehydrogenase E1 component alpha subunit